MKLRDRVLKARRLYVARRKRKAASTGRARRHYLALREKYLNRKQNSFQTSMLNGHPGNITDACKAVIVRGVKAGLVVTSTTDLTHSTTSYHYYKPLGKAVDFGGPRDKLIVFQRSEAARGPLGYNELFGPDNFYIKNGERHSGAFPKHGDHVHVAPR